MVYLRVTRPVHLRVKKAKSEMKDAFTDGKESLLFFPRKRSRHLWLQTNDPGKGCDPHLDKFIPFLAQGYPERHTYTYSHSHTHTHTSRHFCSFFFHLYLSSAKRVEWKKRGEREREVLIVASSAHLLPHLSLPLSLFEEEGEEMRERRERKVIEVKRHYFSSWISSHVTCFWRRLSYLARLTCSCRLR